MRNFNYHLARDVADAAAKIIASEDGKLMAGGMTLIPTLKQRLASPDDVIDLGAIAGLKGIAREGDEIVIGAMTTHAEVAASDIVRSAIPALAEMAGGIGDPAVRHRGTIGGSTANADPAADYPGGIVGLGASIVTNTRKIAGDEFFTGLFETALESGEIITQVRFPIPRKAHYLKFRHPASGYAVVGVMVARTASGVRVGVTGAGPSAFRASAFEAALSKDFNAGAIGNLELSADGLLNDIHFSGEYRAHVAGVFIRRCVAAML
ncbi:MAG: xanthine dehydrogenase family protein subunit M [Alphaproteobacteria bacterium]|nr:xanthine dehydrogenase family protein subunit M [Alphaproteobacteria bacterium]